MRKSGSFIDLLIGCIKISVTDIVADGSGKQVGILQDNTEGTAQIVFFNLCNIDAVVADLSFLNIIKTVNQVGDCCLTGTGGTYKCQFLSWFGEQADIL